MFATDFPLPITHQYRIAPGPCPRAEANGGLARTRMVEGRGSGPPRERAGGRDDARPARRELEPTSSSSRPSAFARACSIPNLKPAVRRIDPLIEEAREAGGGEHRFGQHGDLLDEWIAPLFDDTAAMRRLRLASCLLADVAWQANPGFRADRGSRNGAARQLGRGRARRPGDHGPGAVVQFRPRPIARPASSPSCAPGTSSSARTTGASRCASASGCRAEWRRC